MAAIGKLDASEVAKHIVVVGRGEGALSLRGQLPVHGVGIARPPMVDEPVLGIVVPDLDTVEVGAVAAVTLVCSAWAEKTCPSGWNMSTAIFRHEFRSTFESLLTRTMRFVPQRTLRGLRVPSW